MADSQSIRHAHNFKDITGQRFGMLTVLRFVERVYKDNKWECLCDCGRTSVKRGNNLKCGGTKSCGCNQGRPKNAGRKPATPGRYCWQSMRQRCYYAKDPHYHNYGGRGIAVCEEWRQSFDTFIRDMGPRPTPLHTIERMDNDGPYCPSNCRWATGKEQSNNRRNNARIAFRGITKTLSQWAGELGIKRGCLAYRLKHWDLETAMTAPVNEVKSRSSKSQARECHQSHSCSVVDSSY